MIISPVAFDRIDFPAGEMHIRLKGPSAQSKAPVNISWLFKTNEDIIELLLYCDALKQAGIPLGALEIPYFPFSRQDRVAVPGDCFSLKVMCELVNSLKAEQVIVYDPHSYVLPALLNNCKAVSQAELFVPMLNDMGKVVLVSPDAGAYKKTTEIAIKCLHLNDVVECSKQRDPKTGVITGTHVFAARGFLNNKTCVIVDDICDGGRTFIEIAKAIRADHMPKKIVLMVTHGIFSKGTGVFEEIIDEVYTYSGRVQIVPEIRGRNAV